MRVENLSLRIVFSAMRHFKQNPKHGFAGVGDRFVDFYESSECDSCFALMDEIDLERKISG